MFHPITLRRFFRLTALTGFFLVPLVFFTELRDQFELPKMILVGILALGVLSARWLDPRKRTWVPLEIAVGVLLGLQLLSSLPGLSLSWRTSLVGDYENFGGWLSALAFAGWFWGLARGLTPGEIRRFHFILVTAGLLSALYALGQQAGLDFLEWNPETYSATRVFASLGNPNFLSAFLAMILPLHLREALPTPPTTTPATAPPGAPAAQPRPRAWFPLVLPWIGLLLLFLATHGMAERWDYNTTALPMVFGALGLTTLAAGLVHPLYRRGTFAAWGGALVLGAGLVATGSRGGWLGALAGLAVQGLLTRGFRRPSDPPAPPRPWLNPARALPVLLLLGALAWIGTPFFRRLGQSIAHPLESLAQSRLTIWEPALRMAQAHPWVGVGLDCFKVAFPRYSRFDFNQIDGAFVSSRTAHNEWLQALATTGVPGLLATLAVLFLFLRALGDRLRSAPGEERGLWVAVAASATAYLVQNLFSFGVATLLLVWNLHLASVARPPAPSSPNPQARGRILWVLAALVAIPIGLRLVADLSFARGMAALDYLKQQMGRLPPEQSGLYADYGLNRTQRASQLFPLDVKYLLYSGMALEQKAELPSESREFTLGQALRVYDQVTGFSPSNAYYQNNRARVLIQMARQDPRYWSDAEAALRRACELAPESPFFLVQWGGVLLGMGKAAEAAPPLRKAFELSPDLSTKTLGQLALDDFTGGNPDLAFTLISELVRRQPGSAVAWFYQGYLQMKVGKMREARKSLLQAKTLNPGLPGLEAAFAELDR